MEIDFNSGRKPITGIRRPISGRESTAIIKTINMSFACTIALQQTLKKLPLVRLEKVAQATTLVADPDYPADAILVRMADLFAKHITR